MSEKDWLNAVTHSSFVSPYDGLLPAHEVLFKPSMDSLKFQICLPKNLAYMVEGQP